MNQKQPSSSSTTIDLRIQKTHKAIQTAFIELLGQKEYEKITVQEITETALISNNTFYKYYAGKSGLAGKMIAEFKTFYSEFLNKREQMSNPLQDLQTLHDKVFAKRELILALWKIKTPRHHLYADMQQMSKKTFITLAQQHYGKSKDWDFQAEIFATMLFSTWKYHLQRGLEHNVVQVWKDWEQILQLIRV
ncbi:TetR/AcrR family transcriptional regulator [Lonepinella koalarum]|uniref:TetR family transcriptional regulator n=1 Tax=Lonepinella koalarum TaxID=53417 RepID=A0A4R1KY66_9PAST|nr:TetR family transcriptional regulator [Lonepinella koalarum]MDH2926919.1 hypothetical protein [Lonepinella koalarum]TCK70422.1 TetR family transcriptional regulator [Lonepinella koalarum]TFJ90189.1 TetR/AcrR family transcriptional regulator [Lonepinella koalarum]TYG33700.1 TetR/AcrR family transcriptional regulator [Lonepinella koalarum]